MGSKYLQDVEERKSKIIHVYPNGDPYARAIFIILRQLEQKDLERIIKAVEEKVRLPRNRPIRKLFEMTGVLVKSYLQVEDGKYYVAASAEDFFPLEYGKGLAWVLVGPVRTSKYANVRFVTRSEEEGPSKSLNSSSNMLASTKDTKERLDRKKSPSKKTPASIKKANRQKPQPQKNMAASEHTDRPYHSEHVNEKPQDDVHKENHEDLVEHNPSLAVEAQIDVELKQHEDQPERYISEEVEAREVGNSKGHEEVVDHDQERAEPTERYEDGHLQNGHSEEEHPQDHKEMNEDDGKDARGDFGSEVDSTYARDPRDESYQEEDSLNVEEIKGSHEEEHHDQVDYLKDEEPDKEQPNEEEGDVEVNEDPVGKDNDKLDEAATKIQATYRGHKVRTNIGRVREGGADRGKVDEDQTHFDADGENVDADHKNADADSEIVDDNTDVSEEINSQKEI